MATYMDYTVSLNPIRIIDRTTDRSKLSIQSLSIYSVGHLPNRVQYRSEATFLHYALVYIADGSGTYRVNNGEKQAVEQGSWFLFAPGSVYDYGPEGRQTWDEYYFTIEGPRIGEWMSSWLTEPERVRRTTHDDAVQNKIDRIFLLMDSSIPDNLDRAALLLESLLFELAAGSDARPRHLTGGDRYTELMEDIAATIHQRFDAEALCKRHLISISTLRRLVHRHTGYSLHEYVHRLKISEAKNRLLNTDQSVQDIAGSLGFADVFYFSRLFKKFSGVSPQHFRHHEQR
ncbi:AraC family transcriptional regulator [Paenibacillus gansuensis]|uniref:AraC family transcriptional regulator n=1 Tax=Paenibacillus gansuensis TaxID=306542 RepID=A0ABW5PK98_9BACL